MTERSIHELPIESNGGLGANKDDPELNCLFQSRQSDPFLVAVVEIGTQRLPRQNISRGETLPRSLRSTEF